MKFDIVGLARRIHYRPPSATVLSAAAIAWLTLSPSPVGDTDIPLFAGADKIAHALMFAGLTISMALDLTIWKRRYPGIIALIAISTLSSIAGGIVELLQHTMQLGRTAELADFAADTAGAAAALIAIIAIRQ